ncbi:hypothetical protein [Chitinophaga tropicalis]|uniref:Uncharacterized protein n=1 Tax=Chitinophaga tropicalis TaxID=2683588 RepID=A0A7K1U7E8_9BACT|nr:hypothetical protein [Chitinophaga tropicalis]MVT10271.1 hypothetical protein [Chitinophaga tropicalis]
MDEQNLSGKHLNSGKVPIPMPPADQAWGAMKQRLDAELPVTGHSHFHINLWKGIAVVATAFTIAGISWWWFSSKPGDERHTIGVIKRDPSTGKIITTTTSQTSVSSEKGPDTINKTITERTISFDSAVSVPMKAVGVAPTSASAEKKPDASEKATGNSIPPAMPLSVPMKVVGVAPTSASAEKEPDASEKATGNSMPPAMPLSVPVSKKGTKSRDMITAVSPVTGEPLFHAQRVEAEESYTGNSYEGQRKNNDEKLVLERIEQPPAVYSTRLENKMSIVVSPSPGTIIKARSPWSLYAQLPVQIPLSGGSNYMMGPNGKNQFYRALIPSVRIEKESGKSALSLDVIPSLNTLFRENKYKAGRDTVWPLNDTTTTLLKQSGWGLALQYHTPVYKNWRLSAGVQASFMRKAVMQRAVTDTMNTIRTTIYAAAEEDWKRLSRFRLNGVMELYYEAGKWQMGLRTLIPVSSAGKNIKTPVQLELLFRRRLWQFGKRD